MTDYQAFHDEFRKASGQIDRLFHYGSGLTQTQAQELAQSIDAHVLQMLSIGHQIDQHRKDLVFANEALRQAAATRPAARYWRKLKNWCRWQIDRRSYRPGH